MYAKYRNGKYAILRSGPVRKSSTDADSCITLRPVSEILIPLSSWLKRLEEIMGRVDHTAFVKARMCRAAGLLAIALPSAVLAASIIFVKTYADIVSNTTQDLAPQDVLAASDGG